jgi:hypothetical protein
MGLDIARSEPARQPEPVSASFEGDGDAFNLARQRFSSFSNAPSSISSFFNGWRSTPGTRPATSQLD